MRMRGRSHQSGSLLEESLELHRALGDKGEIAYTLVNLAMSSESRAIWSARQRSLMRRSRSQASSERCSPLSLHWKA